MERDVARSGVGNRWEYRPALRFGARMPSKIDALRSGRDAACFEHSDARSGQTCKSCSERGRKVGKFVLSAPDSIGPTTFVEPLRPARRGSVIELRRPDRTGR